MATRNASDFAVGNKVTFVSVKSGKSIKGSITKIMADDNKVTVTTDEGKAYNVKADKLQKQRGRPAGSTNAPKTSTSKNSAKVKNSDETPELLTEEEIDEILSTFAELTDRLESHKAAMVKKEDEDEEEEVAPPKKVNRFSKAQTSTKTTAKKVKKPAMEDADEE